MIVYLESLHCQFLFAASTKDQTEKRANGCSKLTDLTSMIVVPDISRVTTTTYMSPAPVTSAEKRQPSQGQRNDAVFAGSLISEIVTPHSGAQLSIYDFPACRSTLSNIEHHSHPPHPTIGGSTTADSGTLSGTLSAIAPSYGSEMPDVHGTVESRPIQTVVTSQCRFALPLDGSTRTPLLIQRMVSSSSCAGVTLSSVSGYDDAIQRRSSFTTHSTVVAIATSTGVRNTDPSRTSSEAIRPTTTAPALDAGHRLPSASFDMAMVKSTSTAALGRSDHLWRFPTSSRPLTGSTVVAAPASVGGGRPARFPRMGQSCLTVGTDCGGHRGSQRPCAIAALTSGRRTDTKPDLSLTSESHRNSDVPSSNTNQQVTSRSPPYYCVGGQLTASSRSQFFI